MVIQILFCTCLIKLNVINAFLWVGPHPYKDAFIGQGFVKETKKTVLIITFDGLLIAVYNSFLSDVYIK